MKPGTEKEDEYVASNHLLLMYLNSHTTVSLLGAIIVKTILLFLRCNFFTHKSHFFFYKESILIILTNTQTAVMKVILIKTHIVDVIQIQT